MVEDCLRHDIREIVGTSCLSATLVSDEDCLSEARQNTGLPSVRLRERMDKLRRDASVKRGGGPESDVPEKGC